MKNDVCLPPGVALSENCFMPPAGDFLPIAFLHRERVSDGLLLLSRALFVMGRSGNRHSNRPAAAPAQVKGRVGLPPWRSVPHGRTANFFNCPRSGSESRSKPIPCFGKLWEATLAHREGSAETMGFCWRQKRKTAGKSRPPETKKILPKRCPSKAKPPNQLNRFMARSGPCEINTSAASPARSSASISTF